MLCVLILYISGGTYSLKPTPNYGFFEKLFIAILFTLWVFARKLLSGNRRINTFRILFWCLAWNSNSGFMSNKTTHYLLNYGYFSYWIYNTVCRCHWRIFFENHPKRTVTIDSEHYCHMINDLFYPEIKNYELDDMWFQ